MDVFDLHEQLISDYGAYTQSFIRIADERIRKAVNEEVAAGLLWPDPLLQLNPKPASLYGGISLDGIRHHSVGFIT